MKEILLASVTLIVAVAAGVCLGKVIVSVCCIWFPKRPPKKKDILDELYEHEKGINWYGMRKESEIKK